MPRAKIETAFLGHYTLAILDECDAPDAGVLIRALAAWILRDELAEEADLPAHLRVLWRIIRDESNTIHAAREQQKEAGRAGGIAKGKRTDSEQQAKGKRTDTKIEIEVEREVEKGKERETPRAPACEDFPDCPIPEDRLRVLAAHIGAPSEEVAAWKDYYTAQEWRFKPVSPRPMTQAAAEASLRNWHNLGGVRAAKQAHVDAIERAKELAWARSPVVNIDELDKLAGTAKKEA